MDRQNDETILDPDKKSDMAYLKSQLMSENSRRKNTLRFYIANVIFDKPLEEHQADTIINLLKDVKTQGFDLMDTCVHTANLIILLGIKARFRAKFQISKPRVSVAYARMCKILNDQIKDREILPWKMHGHTTKHAGDMYAELYM